MDDQGGGNYHYRYHGEDQGVETTGDGALSVTATAGKLTVNAPKLNSGNNQVQLYGANDISVSLGSRRQNSDSTLDFKGHTPTLVKAIDVTSPSVPTATTTKKAPSFMSDAQASCEYWGFC